MAPIEPDLTNSNLRPLAFLSGYITLTASVTGLVCYDVLYKAYRAMPPSQETRHRKSNRDKHIQMFSALSLASLGTSCFNIARYLILSYRVWANDVGEKLPTALFKPHTFSDLSLGRWLRDTSLYLDAWEIAIERSRRFWWTQQLFLGVVAWSVYVGLEGRRRNIRHLWAFALLTQLVGVSFAMNLFFLAVLLTAIPLAPQSSKRGRTVSSHKTSDTTSTKSIGPSPSGIAKQAVQALQIAATYLPPLPTRPHPATWTPHPLSFIPTLLVANVTTFILPFSTHTTTFVPLLLVASLVPYRLIYPDRLGPIAYGSSNTQIRSYTPVYRYLAYASLLLFFKQTFVALLDNDPGAHSHRHNEYLAALHLPHPQERSSIKRSSSAVAKVLGALSDHSMTAAIGYDVLLCALSLCCWAVIRGLDISKLLNSAGLTSTASGSRVPSKPHAASAPSENTSSNAGSVRRRKRKSTLPENTSEPTADDKAAKNDMTYQPDSALSVARGEEEEHENAEAGAVSGVLFALGGLGTLAASVLGAEDA